MRSRIDGELAIKALLNAAKLDIFEYIVIRYNVNCRQNLAGNVSPVDFETRFFNMLRCVRKIRGASRCLNPRK